MVNIYKEKSFKNLQKQKSSPDPENFRYRHQQTFNLFLVFAVIQTLPDCSEAPKVIPLKQKNMIHVEIKKSGEYLKRNEFQSRSKKTLNSSGDIPTIFFLRLNHIFLLPLSHFCCSGTVWKGPKNGQNRKEIKWLLMPLLKIFRVGRAFLFLEIF